MVLLFIYSLHSRFHVSLKTSCSFNSSDMTDYSSFDKAKFYVNELKENSLVSAELRLLQVKLQSQLY